MTESDVTGDPGLERFRVMVEPVRPQDWVETVDAAGLPVFTGDDERARLLRLAGGGEP